MKIRDMKKEDVQAVVDILKHNNQFHTPDVDGDKAMLRSLKFENNVMLVCETRGQIAGLVIGSWDGARAVIHKVSVHPDRQNRGIGSNLILKAAERFKEMGAPTLGVTAADGTKNEMNDSIGFFEALGFKTVAARLMVHFDIEELRVDSNED